MEKYALIISIEIKLGKNDMLHPLGHVEAVETC